METQTYIVEANIPSWEDFSAQYPQYRNLARNEFQFIFELLMSPKHM